MSKFRNKIGAFGLVLLGARSRLNFLSKFLRATQVFLGCFLLLFFSSCRDNVVAYALKQGVKQGSLVLRAQPVKDLLKDPSIDSKTAYYLELSEKILSFAKTELKMNVGKSYQKFYDVGRPWITKIIVAAHKDKLKAHLFEYPIVGKLPYKGFFDEADALDFQKKIESKGYDAYLRNVPAFSSLGWWPDPLLSTMFGEEVFFIELLLHELVHLNFYFDSQADFNEAFATWFAKQATKKFVLKNYSPEKSKEFVAKLEKGLRFELEFIKFIELIREKGNVIYSSDQTLEKKRTHFFNWIQEELSRRPRLAHLKKIRWNNAYIVSLSTYYKMYMPIDNYATKNKLSEVEFLNLVKKTGEPIIRSIGVQ